MLKDMYHESIRDTNLTRNEFTRHGLHMNSSGKENVAKIIVHNKINPLKKQYPPFSLKWKEVPKVISTDEAMIEFISENVDD